MPSIRARCEPARRRSVHRVEGRGKRATRSQRTVVKTRRMNSWLDGLRPQNPPPRLRIRSPVRAASTTRQPRGIANARMGRGEGRASAPETLSRRLARLNTRRQELGCSQAKLMRILDVSASSISRLFGPNERKRPRDLIGVEGIQRVKRALRLLGQAAPNAGVTPPAAHERTSRAQWPHKRTAYTQLRRPGAAAAAQRLRDLSDPRREDAPRSRPGHVSAAASGGRREGGTSCRRGASLCRARTLAQVHARGVVAGAVR